MSSRPACRAAPRTGQLTANPSKLDLMARERIAELDGRGLRRRLFQTMNAPGQSAMREGRALVNFSSNDYLGLAQDPRVKTAAATAIAELGAGAGASRLVTGDHPALNRLETCIAHWKGAEAALVFGSGYLANIGAIPALAGDADMILIDELAHACQIAGTRLSKAQTKIFSHNDMADLERLLRTERPAARHCWIISEGVFSMDGDLADLPRLIELARRYDAWTMIDDAHALGVLGHGRGSSRHWGVAPDVQMGTLSKAAGSYGGYIAASRPVIELLISSAASFVFATGLPPGSAAAAEAALTIMMQDSDLCARPLQKAQRFCMAAGLPPPQSSIVPIVLGEAHAALEASAALERQGFLVTAIRPPTVPPGTARLRVTFCADHSDEDVDALAQFVRTQILAHRAA